MKITDLRFDYGGPDPYLYGLGVDECESAGYLCEQRTYPGGFFLTCREMLRLRRMIRAAHRFNGDAPSVHEFRKAERTGGAL